MFRGTTPHRPHSTKDDRHSASTSTTDFNSLVEEFRHKLDSKPMLLKLNVGGLSFIVMHKNVEKYPLTRLYHLVSKSDHLEMDSANRTPLYDGTIESTSEYFFDRSAVVFEAIASFYRSGILHKPETVCSDEFMTDTIYFGIIPAYIEALCPGCASYLTPHIRMRTQNQAQKRSESLSYRTETLVFLQPSSDMEKANGGTLSLLNNLDPVPKASKHIMHLQQNASLACYKNYEKIKSMTWRFLEEPETSRLAMIAAGVSVLFILATVIIMVMESMPQFQICQDDGGVLNSNSSMNSPTPTTLAPDAAPNLTTSFTSPTLDELTTSSQGVSQKLSSTLPPAHWRDAQGVICECSNTPLAARCTPIMEELSTGDSQEVAWTCACRSRSERGIGCEHRVSHPGLDTADTVVIAWFTIEYFLRLWSAPRRLEFMREGMSMIDLASIFPYYLEQILRICFSGFSGRSLQFTRGIRIIRLFRILRLLKLSRYSKGMQILGLSLKRSAAELGLMLFYTMLTTMFFSSLLYYLESDAKNSTYKTIPDAAWWSMVSLFGYADAPPTTTGGKLVAAAGTMAGVILLALPITIIVDKFGRTYEELQHSDPNPVR